MNNIMNQVLSTSFAEILTNGLVKKKNIRCHNSEMKNLANIDKNLPSGIISAVVNIWDECQLPKSRKRANTRHPWHPALLPAPPMLLRHPLQGAAEWTRGKGQRGEVQQTPECAETNLPEERYFSTIPNSHTQTHKTPFNKYVKFQFFLFFFFLTLATKYFLHSSEIFVFWKLCFYMITSSNHWLIFQSCIFAVIFVYGRYTDILTWPGLEGGFAWHKQL